MLFFPVFAKLQPASQIPVERSPGFPFSHSITSRSLARPGLSACSLQHSNLQPSNVLTFGFPYLLPSSVSCNSFVCHSYENCRGVYQQFPFRNTFTTSTPSSTFRRSEMRTIQHASELSLVHSYCCALFCTFCTFLHSAETQLVCFHALPNSLSKNAGQGGMPC